MPTITPEQGRAYQWKIYRATLLLALAFGAAGPIFRQGDVAKFVGLGCIVTLTYLAAYRMLRPQAPR